MGGGERAHLPRRLVDDGARGQVRVSDGVPLPPAPDRHARRCIGLALSPGLAPPKHEGRPGDRLADGQGVLPLHLAHRLGERRLDLHQQRGAPPLHGVHRGDRRLHRLHLHHGRGQALGHAGGSLAPLPGDDRSGWLRALHGWREGLFLARHLPLLLIEHVAGGQKRDAAEVDVWRGQGQARPVRVVALELLALGVVLALV
mmetsp:Transcript_38857/g.110163  ORF Transcript_38857/g.110163 Transcript_38857/m.110163 type:complete len:201 (-) Transcript_38857:363-965(-)